MDTDFTAELQREIGAYVLEILRLRKLVLGQQARLLELEKQLAERGG